MTRFYIISLIILINVYGYGQNYIQTDSLIIGTQTVICIDIPATYSKTITSYEEGIIYTYYFPKDSVILSVFSGGLNSISILKDSNSVFLSQSFIEKKNRQVFSKIKGYTTKLPYDFNMLKNIGYFRVDSYNDYSITITYENVNKFDVNKYDSILDNVRIYIKY